MAAEDKACPFCGGQGAPMLTDAVVGKWGAIICRDCGVVGPEVRTSYAKDVTVWAPLAWDEWNKRAEPAASDIRGVI